MGIDEEIRIIHELTFKFRFFISIKRGDFLCYIEKGFQE